MKGGQEFFLAVSNEGLDSAIAEKIASGCLLRLRSDYSALYSFKACFKGILCKRHACICREKIIKISILINEWES